MELHYFDRDCVLATNGEKNKYLYNKKDKWVISSHFDKHCKLSLTNEELMHAMDNLISGEGNETPLLKYLGVIDAPLREVQNTLAAGKYFEMYKKKAEKLPELYKNKEEKMASVFNSMVKSLVDLIK